MNILYLFADSEREWNCSEWRCVLPANAINNHTDHEARLLFMRDFIEPGRDNKEPSEWADIVIFQRLVISPTMAHMENLKALGKAVVGEVDDGYHYMPPSVRAYPFWHKGQIQFQEEGENRVAELSVKPIEQLDWAIKNTTAITTPSKVLCQYWERYHPNVFLMPNYADTSMYKPREKASHPPKILGWGGSFTHLESWRRSKIIEGLRGVMAKHNKVEVHIAGGDFRVHEMIKADKFRKKLIQWIPYKEWPSVLQTFDIGLIPLYGKYDTFRSWIKPLEYTLMGIPWIASASPVVEDFLPYGTLVNNTARGWREAINDVIENYDYHLTRVHEGLEYAKSKDIFANAHNIIDIYEKIINLM